MNARTAADTRGLAEAAASAEAAADCTRRSVGSASINNVTGTVIRRGANRSPLTGRSCTLGQCPRGRISTDVLASNTPYGSGVGECFAVHAEMWVLINTTPEEQADCTLYITHEPCHQCMVMLPASFFTRVVWPTGELNRNNDRGSLVLAA